MDRKPAYSIDELLAFHPGGRTNLFDAIRTGRLRARKLGARTIVLDGDYIKYLEQLPVVEVKGTEASS